MSAWFPKPVQLHSSRAFTCESADYTTEQCKYYRQHWHFWYISDHVFGLSTIAFFMCALGTFIIGHIASRLLRWRRTFDFALGRRLVAATRFLSYRGFYVKAIRWNSAPIGLLLLGAIGTLFFLCMDLIPQPYYWPSEDYGTSPPLSVRSGWMALACMPFIFATASKANWITLLTGVSHERLQVFHRWISYAFFVLALMHTFPFIVYHIHFHDMAKQFNMDNTFEYWTGIVALTFQAWLTFMSFSTIRNLGYEFFKLMHFIAAVVFMVVFFWHCGGTLTSWDYFIATAAIYIPCLVFRWFRTCFKYGLGQKAHLALEDNGFTRITIPANFTWVPGQHCFLRFIGSGVDSLTAHPFTICSLPSSSPNERSELIFYIRHQGGTTKKLHDYAVRQHEAAIPVHVDGPYGGVPLQKSFSSDRLMIIAGGAGAGWCLPCIEQFARSIPSPTDVEQGQGRLNDRGQASISKNDQPRRIFTRPLSLQVILATRDRKTPVWFLQAVRKILYKYPEALVSSDVRVQVYLTSDADPIPDPVNMQAESASETTITPTAVEEKMDFNPDNDNSKDRIMADERSGRPDLPTLIQEEAAQATELKQSMSVFACGPNSMQNDIRNAVARENLKIIHGSGSKGVYLHMEYFSWA